MELEVQRLRAGAAEPQPRAAQPEPKLYAASRARLRISRFKWRARLRELIRARELGTVPPSFDATAYLAAAADADRFEALPDLVAADPDSAPSPTASPQARILWLGSRLARMSGGLDEASLLQLDELVGSCAGEALQQTATSDGQPRYSGGGPANRGDGVFFYPNGVPLRSADAKVWYPTGRLALSTAMFLYPSGRVAYTRFGQFTPGTRLVGPTTLTDRLSRDTPLWPLFEWGLRRLDVNAFANEIARIELLWRYFR